MSWWDRNEGLVATTCQAILTCIALLQAAHAQWAEGCFCLVLAASCERAACRWMDEASRRVKGGAE